MSATQRWIVDRHEGDVSVVEIDGRRMVDLPRSLLPTAARGDDVLSVTVEADADRAVVTITRDPAATERDRAEARATIDRLRRRDPGGDVRL